MTIKKTEYTRLTKEEEDVIINKGTEPPFTGKYYHFWEKGKYICKRCRTPLYSSNSKFDSGSGWPSFSSEISGRVNRSVDADGVRTEITCATCGAHLGHVFTGESYGHDRHCVNSISIKFIPEKKSK
jgi:methionine-R-sulfoxide reductase